MTSPEPRSYRSWVVLLCVQVGVALSVFGLCVAGFVGLTQRHGDDIADLIVREHLGTVVGLQLGLVPAYLFLAAAYTVLTWPVLVHGRALHDVVRGDGRGRRTRLLLSTLAVDLAVFLLSFGPFFGGTPGLLDDAARLLARLGVSRSVDLYVLERSHLPAVTTVGFVLVVAWAALSYGRSWWKGVRRSSGKGRLLRLSPVAIAAVAVLASAYRPPSPATRSGRPNVVILASDSLRWDHLGVHGYERADISPNIDAFAAQAADLSELHVATASTLESWTSMLSGRFPPSHGLRYMYATREQVERVQALPDVVPKLLRDSGYHTAVVSDWAGNCFKLVDLGFDRTLVGEVQNFDALIAEATISAHLPFPLYFTNALGPLLFPPVRRTTRYVRPGSMSHWLIAEFDEARRQGKPFFGLLFFSTTHIPYKASSPFNTRYVDPAYDGPHRYQIDVTAHELISTGFAPTLPAATRQHIRDLYDGAVSEFDHRVGEVFEELRRRDLLDDTIIIITSDHGEDLYDPGSTLGHGTNFFGGDQSTRIPFFVRVPGLTTPGSKIAALARNVDVAPSLLSWVGLPAPDSYEGVDLTPLLDGTTDDLDLPVFSETCYLFFPKTRSMTAFSEEEKAQILEVAGARDTLRVDDTFDNNLVLKDRFHQPVLDTKDRMVRTRRWKLVHVPGKERPIYRLWDIRADPGQANDLSGANLSVMPELVDLLDRYWRGEGRDLRFVLERETPQRERPSAHVGEGPESPPPG